MKSSYLFIVFFFYIHNTYSQYNVSLQQKIAENEGNFNVSLNNEDWFGYAAEAIGDLNRDGINDIAISAIKDDDGGFNRGAVYILFLNNDGTVNNYQKISDTQGGFSGNLDDWDVFGTSLSYLGDMNGDGLIEIGIGVEYDGDGAYRSGAIWILSLSSNGTVNSQVKISQTQGGFTGNLSGWDVFGSDIALLGDLNGDGNQDIAVGSRRHSIDSQDRGAVWVLFLNSDFTVASHQKIGNSQGNFMAGLDPQDYFGGSVANIGDLNNDGVIDLAVGAYRDDDGGTDNGATYIIFLNSNGTVNNYQKISETQGNFNETFPGDNVRFGSSVDISADINGNGLTEIIVGAPGYKNSGQTKGAIYILNLNSNGTVNSYEKITEGLNNFTGPLSDGGSFGRSVSYIGALQENHCIVVGAYTDPVGGIGKGSAWVLQFGNAAPDATSSIDNISTSCNSSAITVDYTIANINGTDILPSGTSIAFYADGILAGSANTQNDIAIGGTESGTITLNIPVNVPVNFTLTIVVDDDGTGTGAITEIDENNNSDSAQVELILTAIANPLEDLFLCDENNDGSEIFDLTINTPLAVGNQNNVTLTYHPSQNDADMDINPILNSQTYSNVVNPQEVFVRLENDMDPTCFVVDSFMLQVVPIPFALDPGPLSTCDGISNDGVATFNLSSLTTAIIGNQNNVVISFYEGQNDAMAGTNAISSPDTYQNISNPQTIYVRVESTVFSDCFSMVAFELSIDEIGTIPFENLNQCDEGFDSALFNLTLSDAELGFDQTITGYYLNQSDAINGTNAILNPSHYQNTSNPQTIYVRINDPGEICYLLGAFNLSTEECPIVIPQGFSPNSDGINDTFKITGLYDIFPSFELTIFSRYGNIVYKGNNDVQEWDGTSNHGILGAGNQLPTGTYYYVLDLNHPDFKVMKSWVYLMR